MTHPVQYKGWLCLLLGWVTFCVHAQEPATSLLIEEVIDETDLTDMEESRWEDELESLASLREHPLNLNDATRQQLEQLPFLNDRQIEEILSHIAIHGEMKSIYELQAVRGLDRSAIQRMLPYVCVSPSEKKEKKRTTLKKQLRYGKQQLLTRLDIPLYTREGYKKSYLGPSLYHAIQYRYSVGDQLQAGLSAEKDAGEPLFALHNKKGYDFYSPYLIIRNRGVLKALALGNYRISFGMGLIMNSGLRLGKSYSIDLNSYRSATITPHRSTGESDYFSGIACTIEPIKRTDLTLFYSFRKLDGVITEEGNISSIYTTGLHRTQQEADKRNQLNMQTAGAHLQYRHRRFQTGLSGIYYTFDNPYRPTALRSKYARYYLQGTRFYNLSAHYRICGDQWNLQGESATGSSGYALLHRLEYKLSEENKIHLTHRLYSHDYWAYYARAFSEGSQVQNENGWYIATELVPISQWKLFCSIDLFAHPWWKYRISKPSQGVDLMTKLQWNPNRRLSASLSYRYKRKERDITGSGGSIVLPLHTHKSRLRIDYAQPQWQSRTTVDFTMVNQKAYINSKGWQITQSITLLQLPVPLKATLQASYFHTDDYESRIYIYEKGMLNSMYTPSFYGEGVRGSLHLRYDYATRLTLLCKWGGTRYFDRQEIGSGNDLIHSNRKHDIQLQMVVRF